jgi:hypothetical protein
MRTLNHFSSKHEVNASGMIDLSGFEGRAAVSVSDHLFISGSYSKSINGLANDRDTTFIGGLEGSHNHRMVEVGVGYYGKISRHYFEFKSGYSLGKSDVYEDFSSSDGTYIPPTNPSRVINGAYNRIFVQYGGLVASKDNVALGIVLRVSSLKFSRIESETKQFVFDKRNRYYFFEPAFNLRVNTEKTPLYILLNLGFSRRIDNIPRQRTNRGDVPETWEFNNTFGIGVNLNNTKRSRNRQ